MQASKQLGQSTSTGEPSRRSIRNKRTMSTTYNDDLHNVDAIVGCRQINGRVEYLIKWEGYSEEDNTWEPESNLDEGALEDAKAYCNKKRKYESSS